ncbi:hypothetical protein Tco_1220920 [Tanacetum coccineum]
MKDSCRFNSARFKRFNHRLQVQEMKQADSLPAEIIFSIDIGLEQKDDINVTPDSSNICNNDNHVDQNAAECQLKKANASLTQELEECRTNLAETSRALGEATSSQDSCLIALQTKQTELEKYTALNESTNDCEICPNGEETLVTLKRRVDQNWDKDKSTSFNGQKQQRIDLNADALYKKAGKSQLVLVLHQMTSDHNCSELEFRDQCNEPSSSKLVPKVVPLAVKTATSRTRVGITIHPSLCNDEENNFGLSYRIYKI